MLKRLAIIIAFSVLPITAFAQEIFVPPVTTANPGYLFPNDQYQRNRENSGNSNSQKNAPAQFKLDAAAQARVRAAVRALVPEYNARAKRHGEQRANAWIRQKAFELGQREARLMKQRPGRR